MKSTILKNGIWLCILGFILVLSACKKNQSDLVLNTDVTISGFTANGVNGKINDTTKVISIVLPFGSDVTKIKPSLKVANGANVSPASGETVDLSLPTAYKVINGNIYSNYTVKASVETAFRAFKIDTVSGVINDISHTITVTVPPGTSVSHIAPSITLSPGLTISPAIGTPQDFTQPVKYTVTSSVTSVAYTVNVTVLNAIPYIAYIGTAPNRSGITNPDEKAAADWLFTNYTHAEYVSFDQINSGAVNLSKYKVIWWHYDSGQSLPDISNWANVLTALKAYYAAGGNFFLTTYAVQYLPSLGIIPQGKGPNNVFGDASPGIDTNNDWGISFNGNASNPLFQGLTLSPSNPTTAYLLGKGTERENHTAQWKVSDWGGYTNTAGWQAQTGGIALASTDGSTTDNTVNIAEFLSKNNSGKTLVINLGAYDWFNEPDPNSNTPSIANPYKPNIIKLTQNAIGILTQ
ncbi:DUF4960 domain-containing protein [Mucilaginibacter polytrichastri]|uniref:DUF4960 domain-containing protein n=1 Tax=Mucilaginibacter polytrichastri TaxID=1302689 RepID=A0A1Q5ZRX6_9SPHI|nr:DUF4960 domain-containing protein [Mucilaginibacter polytrichastri]OKS84519.1 hypothetical protein RG47T_5209 [Mucilaginibacter polytrichastri]SFT23715.1 protein of unknown function [Mucilaginibacter polytrichastri]